MSKFIDIALNMAFNSLDNIVIDRVWLPIALNSSSKGNQRKWYSKDEDLYLKEQFYHQGVYWQDWKVEVLSYFVAQQCGIGDKVVKQLPVRIIDGDSTTYGVVSENFLDIREEWVSIYRIMQKFDFELSPRMMPLDKFNYLRDKVYTYLDLDLKEYLLNMMILDLLMLNEDRHLNNLGVIVKNGVYKEAPLFDFGLGLFEWSKKYAGKTLEQALMYTDARPFDADLYAAVKHVCSSDEYKSYVRRLCTSIEVPGIKFFPNKLGYEHFCKAKVFLEEL